jgi:hypothetical protein
MDLDLAAIDPIWYAVAAGVLLLILVAIIVAVVRKRRKRDRLEDRYGAEYQRTVEKAGSRRAADKELQEREERRQNFDLRPLEQDERDRFRARWEDLQASFVDSPAAAVRSADELIDDVAAKVGYPKADREQRLADLSVDHPATVDEYRSSRPTSSDPERGPTTEQLRQALMTSRSLFEALVGRDTSDVGIPPAPFRELEGSDETAAVDHRPHSSTNGHGAEDDRSSAVDRRQDDARPGHGEAERRQGEAPDEVDVRDREHARSSPVLGPDGRPIIDDDRR